MLVDIKLRVENLLKHLGRDWKEVRKNLIKYKCKGNVGDDKSCPVAVFLKSRLKNQPMHVGNEKCYLEENFYGNAGIHRETVELPNAVKSFVSRFDDKKIPSLINK